MNTVWNYIDGRYIYDNKLYVKNNDFYWIHTDEYFRPLDKEDLQNLEKFKKNEKL